MLYLLFQPLVALLLTLHPAPDLPDRTYLIVWDPERMLMFEDFKSVSGPRGKEAALAVVGIEYSAAMTSKVYQVSIVTMFDTNKSWFSAEELGNEYILKHEQGHFDLAEIYARRLRKAIAESRFNNKNVFDRVSAMYKDTNRKWHNEQQLYDKETNHSIKQDSQVKWDARICEQRESILPRDRFLSFRDEILPSIQDEEFFDMLLKYIFSKIDSEKRFKQFDHLDFQYDPTRQLHNSWALSRMG